MVEMKMIMVADLRRKIEDIFQNASLFSEKELRGFQSGIQGCCKALNARFDLSCTFYGESDLHDFGEDITPVFNIKQYIEIVEIVETYIKENVWAFRENDDKDLEGIQNETWFKDEMRFKDEILIKEFIAKQLIEKGFI